MDWRENINLFWNGKFRFMYEGTLIPNNSFIALDLHDEGKTPTDIEITEREAYKGRYSMWAAVDDCTLIARKIDSLSNDDITRICEDLGYDYILTSERRIIEEYLCSETDGFLHLLSIGVYPFDQSHFEDGTVIDAKTLK